MAGGSEINNELTLDVSQFTSGLERATKKLDSLDSKLDKLDTKSTKLEKDLKDLGTNAKQASDKLGAVTGNLDGLAGGLDRVHKATSKAGDGSKRFKGDLSDLANEAQKSSSAMSSIGDWTKFYGKSLDTLRPQIKALVTSQKELAKVTANSTKAEAKAIQSGIKDRIKDLGSERQVNDERIKARKAMITQLDQLERRATASAALSSPYKTNAKGQEVRRYVGKNSAKHNEAVAETAAYKAQADAISKQKAHISAIVGELQFRNTELTKALQAEQSLLNVNKHILEVERQRQQAAKNLAADKKRIAQEEKQLMRELEAEQKRIDQARTADEKRLAQQRKAELQAEKQRLMERRNDVKEAIRQEAAEKKAAAKATAEAEKAAKRSAVAQEKALAREAANEEKRIAKDKAAAEKQATRDILQAQRLAHKELMAMRREEMQQNKDIAAFAVGAAATGATGAGVNKAADYQDVLDRVRAFNYDEADFKKILERSDKLAAENKFLSKTEALQGSIDAISTIAHNDPKFIDDTLQSVMKDAFILKAKGYDKAELSDIVKNIYGAVDKRGYGTGDYSKEAVKTSDLMRRMVIASSGKITVNDLETVMNNAGTGQMTISDEGWLRLLPLIDQTKTAGGGNGGGGGVARIGTLVKMLQLMGSGRKLTNRAALDFLGADMMSETYADGATQDFKKTAEANNVMSKSLVYAGFKDQNKIAKDPAAAVMAMRGGIIDYMMREDKFKRFFGTNAEKHTYNQKGQMIDSKGEVVAKRTQNEKEMAALLRFFATSGISNNNVTGMMSLMNTANAERAEHSLATAENSKGQDGLMADLSENWHNNIAQLKTQLTNLAISFEPLLTQLVKVPKVLSEIVGGLAEFSTKHNVITSVVLAFVGLKGAILLASGPLRLLSALFAGGGKSIFSFKTAMTAAASGLAAVSGSAKSTGKDVDDLKNKTAGVGDGAKKGFMNMVSSAAGGAAGLRGAAMGILRIVGLCVSWVGWGMLALMFFNIIKDWVKDIKVGESTVGQHMSNFMASLGVTVAHGVNGIRESFWGLVRDIAAQAAWLDKVGSYAEQKLQKIRSDNATAERLANGMSDPDAGKSKSQIAVEKAAKTVGAYDKIKAGTYSEAIQHVGGTAAVGDVPGVAGGTKTVYTRMPGKLTAAQNADRNKWIKYANDHGYDIVNGKAVKKGAIAPPKVEAKHPNEVEGFAPTPTNERGPDAALPTFDKPKKPKKERGAGGGEFNAQNAFEADYYKNKFAITKDDSRIQELLGNPADYAALAKAEFTKKWMAGEYDDARDPSKRKFVQGDKKYDKTVGWKETDINWGATDSVSGISVNNALNVIAERLKQEGVQKSLEFAAGKLGETVESLTDAFDTYDMGVTADSSKTASSKRQYAKFEAKNKTATEGSADFQNFKALSLAAMAGQDYADAITTIRKSNKESAFEFSENEIKNSRNVTHVKYMEGLKQRLAYQSNLEESLRDLEEKGLQDQEVYKKTQKFYEQTQEEMSKFNKQELERRKRDTESAFDQQMRAWRDYESNVTNTLSNIGQKAATDIWDILNKDQTLDVKGFLSESLKQVGGDLFKSAWGGVAQKVMGSGEGTNVFDYLRDVMGGKESSEDGLIGKWLNKIRGIETDSSKEVDIELQGDEATNANTTAVGSLTQAVHEAVDVIKTKFGIPSGNADGVPVAAAVDALGQMTGWNAAVLGEGNVNPVDLINGNGLFLDQIIGSPGQAGEDLNGLATSLVGGFDGTGSLAAAGDIASTDFSMFDSIKMGFSQMFSANGEGGVFSSIKSGFGKLFSESGGLMSKIGGSFGSIFSGIGSIVGSLFGGSGSKGAKVANGVASIAQGYATGGYAGAISSGVTALFSANGNAFSPSGHVQAFANGGAFTNGLYDSPTMFKFANGGGFSQGVMGEAGPEAVMPLQRDGSGRLGVAVNGGSMQGGGTVVSINIEVNNNGGASSESQSGDKNSDWNGLSSRVKSVVQEEIAKQKRPGGMLR